MNSEAYRRPRWPRNFTHGPWETIIKCISGSGLKIACAVLIFKRNVVYMQLYCHQLCSYYGWGEFTRSEKGGGGELISGMPGSG